MTCIALSTTASEMVISAYVDGIEIEVTTPGITVKVSEKGVPKTSIVPDAA